MESRMEFFRYSQWMPLPGGFLHISDSAVPLLINLGSLLNL